MSVDPYVVRLPDRIVDPNTGGPTDEFMQWLVYDNRFKHDLWRTVTDGTGEDQTGGINESSANENQISLNYGLVQHLIQRVDDLENDVQPQIDFTAKFNNVVTTVSYDAADWDFINAKSGSTIALPQHPEENSVIIVRNGDNSGITVNANGKKINGSSTAKIQRLGTSLVLHYFIDSDEWLIR